MYICFLANPQNLDISDLLDVPLEQSPFARALSTASHMLVIPNCSISIYTRLWCCYEAYAAVVKCKTIVLPPAKVFVKWMYRHFVTCLISLALGCSSNVFLMKLLCTIFFLAVRSGQIGLQGSDHSPKQP